MIQEDLAKQVLKNLSHFKLAPVTDNRNYYFKDTLKQCLLDSIGSSTITVESNSKLTIQISSEEFGKSLFSDFHFGRIRIEEQIKNVNNLLASNSQVSWIITTAYYACYFMAVEIAKLYGEFIINLSEDELKKLLSSSESPNKCTIIPESRNSYKISVKQSSNPDSFLDLHLNKEGSHPHQIVWINLFGIINKLKIDDSLLPHKNLLLDICHPNRDRWKLPSAIRNEWNYTYADYYSDRGTDLGKKFLSIIRSADSAMGWASLRTIQPTEVNITASIAYLYHCLSQTIVKLDNRFNQS